MSGITPILDTLLHQVLGKRVDTPVVKDLPLPVSAATSADAIQPARSDSRLHQQGGQPIGAAPAGASREGPLPKPAGPGQANVSSAQLHLSHAATDIADILSRFPASQTTAIRPLLSLWAQSGGGADSLATALSQSVRESGAFYESHLLRWISGHYPRAALMREPQAWLSLTFRPFTPTPPLRHAVLPHGAGGKAAAGHAPFQGTTTSSLSSPPSSKIGAGDASPSRIGDVSASKALDRFTLSEASNAVAEDRSSSSMTRAHQLSQAASDTLQSLVRHQLELIAAPGLRWEGQPWPGVTMTMILTELPGNGVAGDDAQEAADRPEREREEDGSDWRAEVQVRLPTLGAIDIIFLARRDAALEVEIKPADERSRARLAQDMVPLRERLAAWGVSVELAEGTANDE